MKINKLFRFVVLMSTLVILFISGCASLALHGGSLVSKSDNYIKETIVEYKTEGTFPKGASYSLVRTKSGLSFFEQNEVGEGTLFETHWEDSEGDHFAAWISIYGGGKSQHGYEFIVSKDRKMNALRYVYPYGTYIVREVDGIERPVSTIPAKPATTLIPVE